jgi:NADH-quinone oxidoreductase subunit A
LASETLASVFVFVVLGLAFVLVNLSIGRLVRPHLPDREKAAIYECGEPSIGSGWVQFDIRFYVVALFYLVFDVEIALIYPWASIFRQYPLEAMVVGVPFIGLVVVGFIYEWASGSLDWVRSHAGDVSPRAARRLAAEPLSGQAALARRDPEAVLDQAEPLFDPAAPRGAG